MEAPTTALALNGAGAALQFVGVIVTGVGLRRAWREFGPDDEGWWDPIVDRSRQAWRKAAAGFRRILRIRKSTTVHIGGAGGTLTVAVTGRGRKQFRALPDNVDVRAALSELDERTREVMDKTSGLHERLDAETSRLGDELQSVQGRLDDAVGEMEKQDRRIAAGGARVEALGLFLIAAGLACQGLAALL